MGWYGGQEGAARLRWHDQSRAAYNRFLGSIGRSKLTSFYERVVDNRDSNVSSMLIRNPMSQEDLVKAILEASSTAASAAAAAATSDSSNGWAVAIAASENLTDLSLLDDVAGRITGLFLYSCREFDRTKMEVFFSKLTNLESLTLVGCSPLDMYREDGIFLKMVFSAGMLPKLKFLETDAATDDTIAAMSSCPDLAEITFTYPTDDISNEGFQRLVDAGGAKELMKVSAGTLKKHLSKSLTSKYIAATLPKLVDVPECQAEYRYLSHMAKGKKKKSADEILKAKYAVEDSKPFAVVPPERMTFTQLKVALERRGVAYNRNKKNPNTKDLRTMLVEEVGWTYDQELAFQNRAKLKHLQNELEKLRSRAASADKDVAKLSSGKPAVASKLYPLLNAGDIESALRTNNVRIPSTTSKRRDDRAQVLHKSGYQGGGDLEAQLAHYRSVSAKRHEKVGKKEGEIQSLRKQMALKDAAGGEKNSVGSSSAGGATAKAGGKRNFQLMS